MNDIISRVHQPILTAILFFQNCLGFLGKHDHSKGMVQINYFDLGLFYDCHGLRVRCIHEEINRFLWDEVGLLLEIRIAIYII